MTKNVVWEKITSGSWRPTRWRQPLVKLEPAKRARVSWRRWKGGLQAIAWVETKKPPTGLENLLRKAGASDVRIVMERR